MTEIILVGSRGGIKIRAYNVDVANKFNALKENALSNRNDYRAIAIYQLIVSFN